MTCFAPFPRLLIQLSELFTTRSSGRPIRFLWIVTPTGRGKTAHAVNAYALIVAKVDSHVRWKLFLLFDVHHLFDRSKLSILTRKFIGSMVPWVMILYRKVAPAGPRIGIPVPSRTKHLADRKLELGHIAPVHSTTCVRNPDRLLLQNTIYLVNKSLLNTKIHLPAWQQPTDCETNVNPDQTIFCFGSCWLMSCAHCAMATAHVWLGRTCAVANCQQQQHRHGADAGLRKWE